MYAGKKQKKKTIGIPKQKKKTIGIPKQKKKQWESHRRGHTNVKF